MYPPIEAGSVQLLEPMEKMVLISEEEYKRYIAIEATLKNIKGILNVTESDTKNRLTPRERGVI